MNTKGYQLADGSWSSEYKIGDKFVLSCDGHSIFRKGVVVEFITDDQSKNPRFEKVKDVSYYCNWERLSKYKSETNMSKLKNVSDISIAWNKGNAAVILATLKQLGYPIYRDTYPSTQSEYTLLAGSSGEFCGSYTVRKHHFTSLEDFLKYHFSVEKTPLEVEFEELQAQIKTLSDKAAEIKAKL